jgi:lanthanide-dependent methanol dehydrogenase
MAQKVLPASYARHMRNALLFCTTALLAAGCEMPERPGSAPGVKSISAAARAFTTPQNEDGQWTMAPKNYASTRFSGLAGINTTNVSGLKAAWTFSTGATNGHEATPLVVGDTMYVVTPFPNILYALDLNAPGATKWVYRPNPDPAAQGVACCDVVNRGAAYADGKVIINTLDNHTIAVDAATGRELWNTKLGDINRGETMTMAPLVVKDKVLVGNSGGEMGVRGWIAALDVKSGDVVWRAYSTGPDAECLIGPASSPSTPWTRARTSA